MSFPRWGRGMTREWDSYGEVVRPKSGKAGPRHIGKVMPYQKGDIWRGGLAIGGEVSREVWVRNSELLTVDRPINRFPSGRCPISSCSEEPGGMVALKSPNTICSPRSWRTDGIYGIYTGRDIHVIKVKVGLDCQNFRRVEVITPSWVEKRVELWKMD